MASFNRKTTPTPPQTRASSSSAAAPSAPAASSSSLSSVQPWSVEQLHANAANWSLEGDAQLLETMRSVSRQLEQRCRRTQSNCDRMMLRLDEANLRLENTCNKMLSLKNLQFIEARVRDDVDEGAASTNTVASSATSSAAAPLTSKAAVHKALGNGMRMLNKYFERVELRLDDDSDSDADDAFRQSSIMFRTRNPHDERPLPYLIGSQQWKDKWHVGMLETDDDDDDDDDVNDGDDGNHRDASSVKKRATAEEFSSSSSSDEDDDTLSRSVSLPSNVQTTPSDHSDSLLSSSRPSTQVVAAPPVASDNIYDDMLRPVHQSTTMPAYQPMAQPPAMTVRANRLFDDSDSDEAAPATSNEAQRPEPVQVRPQRVEQQRVKVLPTLPTPDERKPNRPAEAPAPIFRQPTQPAPPTQQAQRSASYGLFADAQPPELVAPTAAPAMKPKPANLFFDDSDDDEEVVDATTPKPVVQAPAARTALVAPPKSRTTFDSTDDESEAEIVPKAKPVVNASVTQPTQPTQPTRTKISQLFDDEPPDDLFDDLFARKPVAAVVAKKRSIFDDEDDELFGRGAAVTIPKTRSDANANIKTPAATNKPKELFNDSDEEDLFKSVDAGKADTKSSVSTSTIQTTQTNTLGSDDDDLFGNRPNTAKQTVSIERTIDSDNNETQRPTATQHSLSTATSSKAPSKTSNIFDSDSDKDDLFNTSSIPSNNRISIQQKTSVALDDNANGNAEAIKAPPVVTTATSNNRNSVASTSINQNQPATSASNIFDDIFADEPPEDDFASLFAKVKPKPSSSSAPKNRKSVFDSTPAEDESAEWEQSTKRVNRMAATLPPPMSSISTLSDSRLVQQNNTTPSTQIADKTATASVNVVEDFPNSLAPDQYVNRHAVDELSKKADANLIEEQLPATTTSKVPTTVDSKSVVSIAIDPSENTEAIQSASNTDVVDKAPETPQPITLVIQPTSDKNEPPELPPFDARPNIATSSNVSSSYAYLFDDVPPEDDFDNVAVVVAPKVAEHKSAQLDASFFDNLPPDDDHFDRPAQTSVNPSSKHESPAGLFDDLPPDDEMNATPASKSTLMDWMDDKPPPDDTTNQLERRPSVTTAKRVFYEDFADTVVAAAQQSSEALAGVSSHSNSDAVIVTDDKPPVVASTSINAIKDKLSQLGPHKSPPFATKDDVSTAKPKKLNSSLQINVAALLPGARRSNPVIQPTETRPTLSASDDDDSSPTTTALASNTRAVESSSGLLVGLTKGRPKPNIRRNPSTRQGRLNEFRKSMVAELDNGAVVTDSVQVPASETASKSIADMLNSDNETDDADWMVSSSQPKAAPVPKSQAVESVVRKVPVPKTTAGLFSDEDDDDDDLFGASSKPLPPKTTPSSSKPPQVPYVKEQSRSSKTTAMLFSDNYAEEDDLFGPAKATQNRTNVSAVPTAGGNSSRHLFSDSDSDDDDLFGSSKTKAVGNDTTKPPPSNGRSNVTTTSSAVVDPLADLWKDI